MINILKKSNKIKFSLKKKLKNERLRDVFREREALKYYIIATLE